MKMEGWMTERKKKILWYTGDITLFDSKQEDIEKLTVTQIREAKQISSQIIEDKKKCTLTNRNIQSHQMIQKKSCVCTINA